MLGDPKLKENLEDLTLETMLFVIIEASRYYYMQRLFEKNRKVSNLLASHHETIFDSSSSQLAMLLMQSEFYERLRNAETVYLEAKNEREAQDRYNQYVDLQEPGTKAVLRLVRECINDWKAKISTHFAVSGTLKGQNCIGNREFLSALDRAPVSCNQRSLEILSRALGVLKIRTSRSSIDESMLKKIPIRPAGVTQRVHEQLWPVAVRLSQNDWFQRKDVVIASGEVGRAISSDTVKKWLCGLVNQQGSKLIRRNADRPRLTEYRIV